MKLARGPSRFWTQMFRFGLAQSRLPLWRVVVEARLDRSHRTWPAHLDRAVTAVFVWARAVEEAEALAALALEREGLKPITADAMKCPPCVAPQRGPAAIARTPLRYLARLDSEAASQPPSKRGARA